MSASKTWLIDGTTDYNAWTHSAAANVTASFDSTTADADGTSPNGSIKYTLSTSASGGACYSEIAGTWENWGVPAGATVTGVSVTAAWQLTAASRLNNAAAIGPFTLRDSSGTLLNTLASATTLTAVTTWADKTSGFFTLTTPSASSTSVRLRLESTVQTASGANPSVILMVDWVRLVIYYRTPVTQAITSTMATVLGKVPGKAFAIASTLTTQFQRQTLKYLDYAAVLAAEAILRLTRTRSVPGVSRLWLKRSDGLRALRYSALFKAPAVQNLAQALAVTGTFTAAVAKRAAKTLALTLSNAVALVKSVGKNIAGNATFTVARSSAVSKIITASTTLTAAYKKAVSKTVAATTTATTTLVKGVNKTLAATTTLTAAIKKAVNKLLSLGASLGVLLGKGFTVILSAINLSLSVVLAAVESATRSYEKLMAVAGSFSVSLSKIPNKLLAVGDTLSANIERRTIKIVAVGAVFAVRLLKQMERTLPASAPLALALGKVMGKTLQVVLALGLGLSKSASKVFAIAASLVTGLDKSVRKTLAVTATFVASVARRAAKVLSVSLTATAAFIKARLKTLALSPAFTALVGTQFVAVIRGLARAIVSRITYIVSAINRTAEATSTVEKVVKARGSVDKES